jgi:hypothetical protein
MSKYSSADRILDAVLGTSRPSPLMKRECGQCGVPTCRKDMKIDLGICFECYLNGGLHIKTEKERAIKSWEMAHD